MDFPVCFFSDVRLLPGHHRNQIPFAPTGYASEEIQRISVFYDGSLYLFNATGFDLPREDGWQFLGKVSFRQ